MEDQKDFKAWRFYLIVTKMVELQEISHWLVSTFCISNTDYFQRFPVLFQTEHGISITIQMALIKISENAFLVIEINKNQVFFVSGKFFFHLNFLRLVCGKITCLAE